MTWCSALLAPLRRPRSRCDGDHVFQVLPAGNDAFRAELTPYCSSLIAVLGAGRDRHLSSCAEPGRGGLVAFLVAAMLHPDLQRAADHRVGVDRATTVGDGAPGALPRLGGHACSPSTYTMVGFFLMLYLILPSANAPIPRPPG